MRVSSNRATRVSTDSRSLGGVSRFEILRAPNSDMCKRTRDRRRGHRQYVDTRPQCFESFFDGDSKPLFFIDDHET